MNGQSHPCTIATFALIGIGMLSGCSAGTSAAAKGGSTASPKATAVFIQSDTRVHQSVLPFAVDTVWNRLPLVYQQLQVPITVVDPTGHQIGNERFRTRRIGGKQLSHYLECGSGGGMLTYADEYDVTIGVVTLLYRAGRDSTGVATVVQAIASRRDVSGYPVACMSKGTLERRIGDLIAVEFGRPDSLAR